MLKNIGVIGAGQMGSGIAHVCALAEFDVKLMDVSDEQLEKARDAIGANMERQVKRSLIQDDDRALALALHIGRPRDGVGREFRDERADRR